uniref:Uncharacterized protein n=1 Tax=Solanum lycopersicum TaxID=4081 RepID=K4BR66_SOLLC
MPSYLYIICLGACNTSVLTKKTFLVRLILKNTSQTFLAYMYVS